MSCAHLNHEPVEVEHFPTYGDTLTVARICTDCHEQLPIGWGCEDCEHRELSTLSGKRIRYVTAPCPQHLELW